MGYMALGAEEADIGYLPDDIAGAEFDTAADIVVKAANMLELAGSHRNGNYHNNMPAYVLQNESGCYILGNSSLNHPTERN